MGTYSGAQVVFEYLNCYVFAGGYYEYIALCVVHKIVAPSHTFMAFNKVCLVCLVDLVLHMCFLCVKKLKRSTFHFWVVIWHRWGCQTVLQNLL